LTAHQLPWFAASYLPDAFGIRTQVEIALWMYAHRFLEKFTTILAPTVTISTIIKQMTGLDADVISYGLDLEIFHPPLSTDHETVTRQKWNLPPRVPLLLHVGRLDTDKRVDRVILAAAQAMRASNAHLLIVGDGVQKPALIRLCRSLGIKERVHFPGFVSAQNGLPEIYRIASLFVTASEIETQGMVLLEAAASGLPLVAVRATSIPEIVHDGVNGYLTESGDIPAMGGVMGKILNDPCLGKSMGRASRTLAERHPDQETFNGHERIYHIMVQENRTRQITDRVKTPSQWKRIKERVNWVFIDRFR
jgi:glycosyltransferase involved in cell wall biosynthesis